MNLTLADLNMLVCGLGALKDDWEGSCVWPECGPLLMGMHKRLMDEIERLENEGPCIYPKNTTPAERVQLDAALKSNFPVTCWQQEDFDAVSRLERSRLPSPSVPDREPFTGNFISPSGPGSKVPGP